MNSGAALPVTVDSAEVRAAQAPPVAAAKTAFHLAHIDGLRALAALLVYVNHAYGQSWSGIKGELPTRVPFTWFRSTLITGHFAVTVFIAVSGFCLALPVIRGDGQLRGGTKEFFRRRARRILPPYYAALALCLLLIATIIGEPTGSLWDVPIEVDWQAIVAHVLLVQDIFRTGRINYVFWSIAVEWQIYFLFPLMVLLARRIGILRMAACALALGFALAFAVMDTRIYRANPHYIGIFALGVVAAYVSYSKDPVFERIRSFRHFGLVAALALGLTLGAIPVLSPNFQNTDYPLYDGGIGIFAFSALVLTSTRPNSLLTKFFALPPLVWLGTFSYSLYLMHAPILQILWQYAAMPLGLDNEATFVALMTLGLGVTIAASYGFFRVFERPFMSTVAKARA
ncbi:MAG: hypothetical protein B6A08_06465 [Sorangiineae bacterium NIC37A_2]|nr:MAG: hypothetical protein B6A08_06465 [Sorangiineae bacterium NIC37A_2]